MKHVHCTFCSKSVEVNNRGRLKSHLSGSEICIGTGCYATMMKGWADILPRIRPGFALSEKFARKKRP